MYSATAKLALVPNAPFLYPLETCFQGVEKVCIGNKWDKSQLLQVNHWRRVYNHRFASHSYHVLAFVVTAFEILQLNPSYLRI